MSRLESLPAAYRRHTDFILLFILFATFRLLALVAFRPGGLVMDFSDFYWYRAFAELTRQGYYPYANLWTTYPPLFPVVMIVIYQVSTLLPPWEFANLWFTLLLGGFFLLFELGNFGLLYLLARRLYPGEPDGSLSPVALRTCWIYAALFVPVYTLTGWFESYPLFFFLLSLYLLLKGRPYLSAFFTGVGFMIKLIPLILVPVAIQLFSKIKVRVTFQGLRLHTAREPSPPPAGREPLAAGNLPFILPFDLPRIALYLAIFSVTVVVIALPFYRLNPALILGSQQITGARAPWETLWALIDGNYDYGVIPLDMRNLAWTPGDAPPSCIPWLPVTAAFGLVYAFLYTRPLNWTAARTSLPFVGLTLCLFMLWSKGYSPQWLGWPLFFVALLLPNLRGVVYATLLSVANIVEANFYFIMFPEERWLLAATVLVRTLLLVVLAAEFGLLIWPRLVTPRLARLRAWGVALLVVGLLMGAIPAGLRLERSYFAMRQHQSPYAATLARLQSEPVKGALLLNSQAVYDWFYPYLRHDYTLAMLDDYAPPGNSVETRTVSLLDHLAGQTDVLWLYDADAAVTTPAEEALTRWLGGRPPAHIQDIDGGRLYLFILK